jgi:hypothetical protein
MGSVVSLGSVLNGANLRAVWDEIPPRKWGQCSRINIDSRLLIELAKDLSALAADTDRLTETQMGSE